MDSYRTFKIPLPNTSNQIHKNCAENCYSDNCREQHAECITLVKRQDELVPVFGVIRNHAANVIGFEEMVLVDVTNLELINFIA